MLPVAVTEPQLLAWLEAFLWPLFRVGAMLMVAPVFGMTGVPARVRVLLALALTAVLAPLLPAPPPAPVFGAAWLAILAQQLLIGATLGFLLRAVFEAVVLGGELISLSMGLSFAQLADPLRGVQTPVLSQFFLVLSTLIFLALDGHLTLIALTARSFELLPVGGAGLTAVDARAVAGLGSTLFLGGVQIALPAMTALLLVNLSFGVMARAAPSLNLLAVGFPVALLFGFAIVLLALPTLGAVLERLLDAGWEAARGLLGAP
jgi:flagellar biosynthesis protein FliR